ncbi:MAG: uracil-DNA glycosylase family protein [Salinirussus sp.]
MERPPAKMEGLAVEGCERCPALVESRSQIVNGAGDPNADLVFVGEAPGREEDAQGAPFVGRSGEVLTAALREAGLSRADVRIANCVRCRPPDNRDPRVGELDNCREYLEYELTRIDPELVVTLGKVPAEHLLDRDVAVTSEAGETYRATLGGAERPLMICLHPAATLYDASTQELFEKTIARAADTVTPGGQRRLEDF